MTDPGNADLAVADLRKFRRHVFAGSFYKQRGNQNARQKIAFVPIGPRTQPNAGGMSPLRNGSFAVFLLANNISAFLFGKMDGHGVSTIWDSYKVESVKTLQT